ncbi:MULTISPECIES: alpha/beta hydrolase [unclassified Crossiella]|uniref:alpha/beta hydrolase n=1 Tax=unclassified Crossiella TaxID=2620835 RepID=UPI001FFE5A41|nr:MULTISPECIES: alpha/beta fold hydrolase [unclassified Crossiella]MCK2240703.1 alpha/beta hydrolase [Crossiella sp. S99.2]MCK2252846.1 alpha/beta hydrolase [Crossiella sp. S99.1]
MRQRSVLTRLLGLVFTVLLAQLLVPSTASATTDPVCQPIDQSVTVLLTQHHMRGTLCTPAGATKVLVMVPGGTYNHAYWDFPYQEGTYNFRKAMNAAGYATAVVDRLGSGDSSRPPSILVTALMQAQAVHKVIQTLRGSFAKVVLIGHSIGSAISVLEAGTHRDVDGVVLTGMTHQPNLLNLATALAEIHPAMLDPQLSGGGYDPTYLTSKPNKRGLLFHDPGVVDPGMLAVDEQTKDVLSALETADSLGVGIIPPYSALINAPVLLAVGGSDKLFCGTGATNCASATTVLNTESAYYSHAPTVSAYVAPGVGHDLNLHPSAPQLQQAVLNWLSTHV